MAGDKLTTYVNKLHSLDEDVLNIVKECCMIEKMLSIGSDCLWTGSSFEGAAVCRSLNSNQLELDALISIGSIEEAPSKSIFEPLPDFKGFYRLRVNDELIAGLKPSGVQTLKKNGLDKMSYLNIISIQTLLRNLKLTMSGTCVIEGPAVTTDDYPGRNFMTAHSLLLGNEVGMSWGCDNVLAIQLKFWPDIVSPWFSRKRHWPEQGIVQEVKAIGCHLVSKCAPNSTNGDEWRISFSLAELILSAQKNEFQKKCYLLAKCIFYSVVKQYIDEKTQRPLSSYHLKTIMFHMLEENDERTWQQWEEKNEMILVVRCLYQHLVDALKEKNLACYFIDEMNLLEGYSWRFMEEMEEKIQEIVQNPSSYIDYWDTEKIAAMVGSTRALSFQSKKFFFEFAKKCVLSGEWPAVRNVLYGSPLSNPEEWKACEKLMSLTTEIFLEERKTHIPVVQSYQDWYNTIRNLTSEPSLKRLVADFFKLRS